jgi:hypothetical protein
MMAITISGLPINTNNDNTIAGTTSAPRAESSSLAPRSMKKNSSRKSRIPVSLAFMASR